MIFEQQKALPRLLSNPEFVSGSFYRVYTMKDLRVGLGYDVHQLSQDRKLILGGVEIPHPQGLLGHSDADVLLHAIIDALLGASGIGDIGALFPDSDRQFKNISSLKLLQETWEKISQQQWILGNIDVVVMAEHPKLRPFFPEMVKKIADTLNCNLSQISLKATTTEKLGFVGREEGIASQAVALLMK